MRTVRWPSSPRGLNGNPVPQDYLRDLRENLCVTASLMVVAQGFLLPVERRFNTQELPSDFDVIDGGFCL